ncbi:MAG: S9 family peptidase [Acidobacteriia bacterium]|nr:S9 family peptidase [Terriglobia bacterium]
MHRVTFLLFLLFSFPAFSQAKHPFTFEDMMKLKRVGEPVPSPDGKWVLFAAVDVDLAANKKTSHIWIVPLNTNSGATGAAPVQQGSGGHERVLIGDQDGDRPRWAPDGKRFAFLSNKEGGSQVWVADFDGTLGAVTGVHKLTSIATEAGGELWSPDGRHILFTSDVYPECDGAPGPETTCNAKKLKDNEESKVKALIFDRLLYRHWNAYKAGKRSHLFLTPVPPQFDLVGANSSPMIEKVRDLTPGDYDSPVFSLGGQDDYAFSPDGQEICYTSNHDKVEATSTNNDLWIVPVNNGATGAPPVLPKNITADNPASDSTPLYSPDGKYIAYRAQQRPGYESDRFRLMLYDRKTGEKTDVLKDQRGRIFRRDSKTGESIDVTNFDGLVGTIAWAPDSKKIYFSSGFYGRSMIHSVEVGNLEHLDRQTGGYDDDLVISPDGKQIIFSRMSVQAPNEIYVAKIGDQDPAKGGTLRTTQLTHLNDAILSQVAISPLESFWFPGAKGDKVEGFLVKPPNFDPAKKYPVKFLIHGGPQGAWGDDWSYRWNPELFATNGYVVIMINFHGSTGYGQKFIDAINGDWGGAPFEDLMKGLDYAEKTYPFIDKDRECALGASYGGYMANWVLGHTDRFKCIVTHDGMFNTYSAWGTTEELWFNNWEFKGTPYTNPEMYDKWNPRNYAKNFKTPTLVIHSQLDYRLDVSEGFQLFTTLQTMGVPSKMLYFPDEGHWVLKPQNSQLWYKTVNDWVDRWTKKK